MVGAAPSPRILLMLIRGEYWWVYSRPGNLAWARIIPGSAIPAAQGTVADWSELPAPAGASLVIVIPGRHVRIHSVNLPTRNRRRFMAALPFALEDRLLPEPEACHFVPLGKTSIQQAIPVAVLEHDYLTGLLKQMDIYGWQLRRLYPDYLAMSEPEAGVWVMDASEQPFLLRFPQGQGGAVLPDESSSHPPGVLRLALEQAANAPQILRVRVTTLEQYNHIKAWSASLDAHSLQLDVREDKYSRADWLARQPLPGAAYNLLTGPYKPSREGGLWRRQLLPTAILTGVLIVIAGLNWFVQGARLQTDYQALQAEIESTYREVFPETRNLVDPRFQMEQQLTSLRERQQTDGAELDFLSRLDQLAAVMGNGEDVRLQLLNFDGSSITVEVNVPDYDALDSLQLQLAETVDVNVENAELRDGRVISRIRLRGQG